MKNWSSGSLGSSFQQNIFYFIIKFFGYIPAYALLYIVVFCYSAMPAIRKRASFYLTHRFPGYKKSPFHAFAYTYRLCLNFGKVLLDRAIMGITGKSDGKYCDTDLEKLYSVCGANKGVIIMTAHTGFGETSMALLNYVEKHVYIVLYFDSKDVDKHYFEYGQMPENCEIINSNSFLGGSLEIAAALEEGAAVCMMGDRVIGKGYAEVPFLGEKAYFPISPYKYAASMGVQVAVCFGVRTGVCMSWLYLADIIDVSGAKGNKDADFTEYAEHFAKLLEDFTNKYPYQFFNFYNMWSRGA